MDLVIKETLEKLLQVLGVPFTGVTVHKDENTYVADIDTQDTSLLIGYHGETIGALQHLLKCFLFKQGVSTETQVVVDVDGYKKRQEESVLRMAERKAEMVMENKKPILLPPMNPYFRRKIHLHLANDPKFKDAVTTESYGIGVDRAIKIMPK
jgi:spoIIIJ-associated protein